VELQTSVLVWWFNNERLRPEICTVLPIERRRPHYAETHPIIRERLSWKPMKQTGSRFKTPPSEEFEKILGGEGICSKSMWTPAYQLM
jgi:hypothetical protein